jgi:hypothetical protein
MVKSSQAHFPRCGDRKAISAAGVIMRVFASTSVLFACLALGSCAGFPGYVSDHWPTWAGGMPSDVPPRPGAPGYEEFISHQQGKDAASSATAAAPAAPAATPVGATAPAGAAATPPADTGNAPPASPGMRRTDDQGVVQGGLY